METKQINLKLSKNLVETAEKFAETYGYKNIQELAAECIREKVFQESEFDETFSEKEIELIEELLAISLKNKLFSTEEEMNKILLG
ncbi:hypothetical protein KAR91_07420 [Candidatus Pacearchaeota archaeon]|nr:hypothetical protein [Candidatus Pacearchaeota archaeon]